MEKGEGFEVKEMFDNQLAEVDRSFREVGVLYALLFVTIMKLITKNLKIVPYL